MTLKQIPILLALALALMANTCQTTQQEPAANPQIIEGALTSAQITELVAGNTGYGEEETFNYRTFFVPDGAMAGRIWGDFGQETDQGRWEVTPENQMCRQWTVKWGGLKRACFEVFKDGETIKLINMDGNADSYEMMVAAGNRLDR